MMHGIEQTEVQPEQEQMMPESSIPGESLTQDPDNRQDYETPPEYTELEDFIDDMFMNLTEEDNLDGVLDPLRKEIPVEDVAQLLLFQAMSSGKINTDLMLMAVEPTIFMLLGLATYAGIEGVVMYPEDDMQDEDEELSAMESAAKEQGNTNVKLEELPAPSGMSGSLIDKLSKGNI